MRKIVIKGGFILEKKNQNKEKARVESEEFSNEFLDGLERNIKQNEMIRRKMKNWNKDKK